MCLQLFVNQQEPDEQAKLWWVNVKLLMILPASAKAESPKLIIHGDKKTKEHLELIQGKLCAQNVVQILIAKLRSSTLRECILVK